MILVVDDYDDTRSILVYLLNRAGYQPVGAASGAEAMSIMAAQVPRLVLLDYTMPGMDGLAVVAAMKANPALRAVPIVMFSALDGDVRDAALAAGANAFVVKGSLDWAEVFQEIVRLIGPGEAPREAPAAPAARANEIA